ncbi:MAG: hypothetical protein JXA21_26175 [Anaerolineae bacterium]|nr:hypothetical protein [Anaerolineae bacterium]
MAELLDTFPAFEAFWKASQYAPLDVQIARWAGEYLAPWPELLDKQVADYAESDLDWRQVAAERVFPNMAKRLPAMCEARRNLSELCIPVYARAQKALDFDSPAVFVLYVGLECGAGWVTTFHDTPAILFGLEAIAECGWSDANLISGLVAHEIGHLAHHYWRAQHEKPLGDGPWWQLYEEGFAQRCDCLIMETHIPHEARADGEWLPWCRAHRAWLAARFLETIDASEPVMPFFGSWFEIEGKRQTGYFLGGEAIQELEKHFGLKEIALLDDVETWLRPILEQWAEAE